MPLAAGTRLGPYEIAAPIGAGGMGEVYRARDTRLGRDVAVKILPPELAHDPTRRQRFEFEARAVAALNHPNIVAIYDVGEGYIVTELVDGGPLRGARFGLRKTLDIAAQIASGLAAAHESGIVHRDLKPDNILLTRDGRVKILDFGLAKLSAEASIAATETMTVHTDPGVVMGTVGYMSPEQIRGLPADQRSDLFNLGLILYEMLAGRRAFQGETSPETMAAILREDPPELPETLPVSVRQIVARCLEKDPANRFQTAKDLGFALSQPTSGVQTVGSVARGRRMLWPVTLAAAVVAFIAGYLLRHAPDFPRWRGVMLGGTETAMSPRLSPDGHTLAFLATVEGIPQVAIMKPKTGNLAILTTAKDNGYALSTSWSYDGTRIFFDRWTDVPRGIYSVPALGGPERLLLEDASAPEALPDGSLMVNHINADRRVQFFRFWPDSGRLEPLPLLFPKNALERQARAFPDGKRVVALGSPVQSGTDPDPHLYIVDLDSGKLRRLYTGLKDDTAVWNMAVTRDGRSVLASLLDGAFTRVMSLPESGGKPHDLLAFTSMVYCMDTGPDGAIYLDQWQRKAYLVRFRAEGGHVERLTTVSVAGADTDELALLSDGRPVVVERLGGRAHLTAIEPGHPSTPLVNTEEETAAPVTAAGPGAIAFLIGPQPQRTIAVAAVSNGRITRRIPFDHGTITGLAASPDGKTIYCAAGGTVWSIPPEGVPTKIRAGDRVVVDPGGKYLIVEVIGTPVTRLIKAPLEGGGEQDVPRMGDGRIASSLSANAIGPDGRIVTPLGSSTWNWPPGVIDPWTGRYTRIHVDLDVDYHSLAWAPDGRILAIGLGSDISLWKFQPEDK